MESRERIADAANTIIPAVLALRSLGFRVRREQQQDGESWWADSDELELVADDPLRLLGLAQVRAERGSDWKATDAEFDAIFREYRLDQKAS